MMKIKVNIIINTSNIKVIDLKYYKTVQILTYKHVLTYNKFFSYERSPLTNYVQVIINFTLEI